MARPSGMVVVREAPNLRRRCRAIFMPVALDGLALLRGDGQPCLDEPERDGVHVDLEGGPSSASDKKAR